MRERETPFVVTSLEELTASYGWRPKTEMLHGGRDKFLEELEEKIGKEGGLTQENLDELGIVSLDEAERPKTKLVEGKDE